MAHTSGKNGCSRWVSYSTYEFPRPHCSDNCETDTCAGIEHTHTCTISKKGPGGIKVVVGRSLQCRKFQETADMLRFLVFTSLAAFGKNRLILLLLWHCEHIWCLTVMLPVFLRCSVLAELTPEPRYLEDDSVEERVVGGQVANPNSWPWQVLYALFDSTTGVEEVLRP